MKTPFGVLVYAVVLTLYSCSLISVSPLQSVNKTVPGVTNPGPFSNWILDSLLPLENTILKRRSVVPVSIDLKVGGSGSYVLQLSTGKKTFRPYVFVMNEASCKNSFSGTCKWFLKARGKTESVKIKLYSVENSASGRTKIITLLKEYRRNYIVAKIK